MIVVPTMDGDQVAATPTYELDASNPYALDALRQYRQLALRGGAPSEHLDDLTEVERTFTEWQAENREKVHFGPHEEEASREV